MSSEKSWVLNKILWNLKIEDIYGLLILFKRSFKDFGKVIYFRSFKRCVLTLLIQLYVSKQVKVLPNFEGLVIPSNNTSLVQWDNIRLLHHN